MRFVVRVRAAMSSTRPPSKPLSANSRVATSRISARVRSGSRSRLLVTTGLVLDTIAFHRGGQHHAHPTPTNGRSPAHSDTQIDPPDVRVVAQRRRRSLFHASAVLEHDALLGEGERDLCVLLDE